MLRNLDRECILSSQRFKGLKQFESLHGKEATESVDSELTTTYSLNFTPKKPEHRPKQGAVLSKVRVPFEGQSTYRMDYVVHELPKPIERVVQQLKRAPFVGSTTYQNDFGRKNSN